MICPNEIRLLEDCHTSPPSEEYPQASIWSRGWEVRLFPGGHGVIELRIGSGVAAPQTMIAITCLDGTPEPVKALVHQYAAIRNAIAKKRPAPLIGDVQLALQWCERALENKRLEDQAAADNAAAEIREEQRCMT